MEMRLPRLREMAVLGVTALLCTVCCNAYFGEAFGGTAALVAGVLLLIAGWAARPSRRETVVSLLSGLFFAGMRVIGYSCETVHSYRLIFRSVKTLFTAGLAVLGFALFAGCAVLLMLRLFQAVSRKAMRRTEYREKERRQVFLFSVLVLFCGSLPYLFLYAPGLNIYDTHDQLLQFFGFPSYIGDGSVLTDHHPVFLTVVYGLFIKLGLLLGDANIGQLIYSLTSMAVLAGCFAYAFAMLYDFGVSRKALMIIAAGVALNPVYALYAFNMCKDISVEPFVILFICQMLRLEKSEGKLISDLRFDAGLFLNMFMMMLTRKPSMYALAFASLFLILRYRGLRIRIACVTLSAVLVFHIGYSSVLLPAFDVVPGKTREMLSIPFQQTANYLMTYDDATPEEMEAVSRILDMEEIPNYNPILSDPIKDTSVPDFSLNDMVTYMKAWISMGLRHPGAYVNAYLCMLYGYFYPSDLNTIVCLTLNSPDEGGMELRQNPDLAEERLGLHDTIYFVLRRIPGIKLFFYVDSITWAFLFMLVCMMFKDGVKKAAPWMFFIGTLGICTLSPKSGEIRYLMPLLYALPVMLGAAFVCLGKDAVPDKID